MPRDGVLTQNVFLLGAPSDVVDDEWLTVGIGLV